jgi:hypothetical protein
MTDSRLKKYLKPKSKHRGIVPVTDSKNKKVFCPLCFSLDIRMQYNDIERSWLCPKCGHKAYPVLSQITLSKSELKASNDFYHNRQKVFFGAEKREHKRIDAFPLEEIYRKSLVYQNLAEAEEATNIHPDEE